MSLSNKVIIFFLFLVLIPILAIGSFFFFHPKLQKQSELHSVSPLITNSLLPTIAPRKKDVSVETIFQYVDPTKATIKNSNPGEYTLIATGDVIPSRSVNTKVVQLGDFEYPFKKTVNFLKSADIVFINLETPLFAHCKTTIEGMVFCGDEKNVEGLVYAGVTVASIGNNHAGNYGVEGINSTVDLLKQHNIEVTGNGQPAIVKVKDKKFGFLGYNDIGSEEQGIAWADIPQIQKDVQTLKKQVDFVIVTFHWGIEYTLVPSSRQIELGHATIDAGADLVVGNHPHWVQGVEEYKGKLITYAHGNYVFDQMWSRETQEGVIGKYTFNNDGLIQVQYVPVIIDQLQPRFANQNEALEILNRMKKSTLQITQIYTQ